MATGVGCAIGPALAAIVIRWLGYMGTNFFFGALIFVIGFAGVYVLPERINDNHEKTTTTSQSVVHRNIPYSEFLTNGWAMVAILVRVVSILSLMFVDAILSVHMGKLGWSLNDTGFAFAMFSMTWGLGSPIVGHIC